jgi:16S rRNA (guanine527-N7)-methyltransferase
MALRRPEAGWSPGIERCLEALGSPRHAHVVETTARLLDKVVEWNAKVDLTAARSADELVDLFVADAAIVSRLTEETGQHWVDVGSGAGAPGIPLSLLVQSRFTLVEPKSKRVAFLRTVVGALGLVHVDVRRERSEQLPAGSFDVAISRATLEPAAWLAEGARLATSAVWLLLARADTPSMPSHRVDREESYEWPLTGAPRRALRYVPL